MAKTIGRFIQFGVARETTRGTAESAASFWIPWDELSLDDKDERILSDQSRGLIETTVGESIIKKWVEADIKAPLDDTIFPLFLYAVLGTLVTSDNADSNAAVKDHTFTVAQSIVHQALTLFIDDPAAGQDYRFALGMVTGLEIMYEKGKFISYGAQLKAKTGATSTLTPASTVSNRFLPHHVVFKMATAQSGLTAASATVLKSANISFKPTVIDDDVLGAISPADFNNTNFEIDGTIELMFDDETEKTLALAATKRALRFDIINTDVTIGAAANPSIRIDLHNVTFQPITRAFKQGEYVIQTIAFKAHYDLTDAKMITAVATNITASY
jgi:Phage tail tube protein